MSVLTPNQIAALIYFVGGFGPNKGQTGANVTGIGGEQGRPPKNDPKRIAYEKFLDDAIAIVLTESGGDPMAKNADSTAVGLWQILQSAHQEEFDWARKYIFIEYDKPNGREIPTVFDPRVNTMVAKRIWELANGWTDWQVFTSGKYKANKGHGKAAYKYITNKKNLEKERTALIVNIMETQNYADLAAIAASPLRALDPGTWKDVLSKGFDNLFKFLKEGSIAVGVFLLGAILLILGVLFMLQRSGVAKKVPGPVGLVASAVKK